MKVLVSAASKNGATAEIAMAMGDVLSERGSEVTVIPSEEAGAIEDYDAVVLGSAVYMGQWMEPAMELVDPSGSSPWLLRTARLDGWRRRSRSRLHGS